MKQNVFAFLLLLFCAVCSAQLTAHNDTFGPVGNYQEINWYSVLSNDTFNGGSTFQMVNATLLSSSYPGITMGEYGFLVIPAGLPSGTYTITYQICEIGNAGNCATASATIAICQVAPPIVSALQPDCTTGKGSVTLSGLPSGNWKLVGSGSSQMIEGSGFSYTFENLAPGDYSFSVVNASGCVSESVTIYLAPAFEFHSNTLSETYVDFNANGFADAGDVIWYQISIANTGTCALSGFTATGNMQFNFDQDIANLTLAAGDSIVLSASTVLTQDVINAYPGNGNFTAGFDTQAANTTLHANAGAGFSSLALPDGMHIVPFFDQNGNGQKDLDELLVCLGDLVYVRNGDGMEHHIQSFRGAYLYEDDPNAVFNLNFNLPEGFRDSYSESVAYNNVSVADGSGVTDYYFPFTYTGEPRISISATPLSTPVAGMIYGVKLVYWNFGGTPVSGTLTFNKDNFLGLASVSENVLETSSGFTYSFTDLPPFQKREILLSLSVPTLPQVSLGDITTVSASITTPTAGTETSSLSKRIVGAYDPNDKTEHHDEQIEFNSFSADDRLTYTIRFENIGTANAVNINVVDVLDEKLDETSVWTVDASHDFAMLRTANELKWRFSAINLPPSATNTDTGHGYVTFKVKPKPGYAVGDVIQNTASIYFDANPAVVTNTTTTEFVSQLSVSDPQPTSLLLYPNPVSDLLHIESHLETLGEVEIFDTVGKSVFHKNLSGNNVAIYLGELQKGLYLAVVKTDIGSKAFKIVRN